MPGLGDFGERRYVYHRYCTEGHQDGHTNVPLGIARDTLRVLSHPGLHIYLASKTDYDFLSNTVACLWGSPGLAKYARHESSSWPVDTVVSLSSMDVMIVHTNDTHINGSVFTHDA